ncbi:Uncharacterised protein [Actinobacillus equuli]|nr:Uncharacterised protein [Actinobacillus equuli]
MKKHLLLSTVLIALSNFTYGDSHPHWSYEGIAVLLIGERSMNPLNYAKSVKTNLLSIFLKQSLLLNSISH